jgi:predicted amidohydrolase
MIFATAQTSPFEDSIEKNIAEHLKWVLIAIENNAGIITFPEMSLTGYRREDASDFALFPDDERLNPFKELARNNKIVIVAGAPVKLKNDLFIGSLIFQPDCDSVSVYTKQFLHPGEELFFHSSFDFNPVIYAGIEQISLAICADIDHPVHPQNAAISGSTFYMPSIFFSRNGIPDAYQKLGDYSKRYEINILMSNFCGKCWGTLSGGKSAFWSDKGDLISSLDGDNPGLLLVEKRENDWQSKLFQ